MSALEALAGESLRRVLDEEPRAVLVDFWSPWCAPCRTMRPHLERLAVERAHGWRFVAVNAEAEPETAKAHAVRALPTIVLFRGGEETFRFAGSAPLSSIAGKLDELTDA